MTNETEPRRRVDDHRAPGPLAWEVSTSALAGLTRYEPSNSNDTNEDAYMYPISCGEWVKLADVERLLAQAAQVAVPDGWKLVPVTSTNDMDNAGHDLLLASGNNAVKIDAERCYAAMLAAAPIPPSPAIQVATRDEVLDAARYRWLREKRDIPPGARNVPWVVALDPNERVHTMVLRAGVELDAAIDCAMKSPATTDKGTAA
jgi:hypothetical protein